MNFDELEIFRAVAQECSITKAATLLGRVPSNVTTRMQQLEADLGVQLLVRNGKRVSLSPTGHIFLDYTQRMLALADEARNVVLGGRDGGTLRIGSMESTAASRLPAVLTEFKRTFPETRLEFMTSPSRQLLEHVHSARLDCAFVALFDTEDNPAELTELGLSGKRVWNEAMVILVPQRDEKAQSTKEIETRSLAAFPQGCAYRALAEQLLLTSSSLSWQVQEVGSYHAMIALVAAGESVALLPKSVLAVTNIPPAVNSIAVTNKQTWLVWRNAYNTPAFTNFQTELEKVLR